MSSSSPGLSYWYLRRCKFFIVFVDKVKISILQRKTYNLNNFKSKLCFSSVFFFFFVTQALKEFQLKKTRHMCTLLQFIPLNCPSLVSICTFETPAYCAEGLSPTPLYGHPRLYIFFPNPLVWQHFLAISPHEIWGKHKNKPMWKSIEYKATLHSFYKLHFYMPHSAEIWFEIITLMY